MQSLQNHLRQLHDKQGDAADILYDVKNVCFREVPIDQLGLLCASLFRSEIGILVYLSESVTSNDAKLFTGARYELCIFLSELIKFCQRHKHSLSDYLVDIKNTCISLFRKEDGNKVKEKALCVVKDLLSLDLELFDTQSLELAKLADLLLTEFAVGKCSMKVKANILVLEGVLLEKFPEHAHTKAKTLQALYLDVLRSNFKSKKPELPMIAAGLTGMASLLHHFASDFVAVDKNIQELYRYMCFGLEPPAHVVQLHIPKAALKLAGEHASVFKRYLAEDSDKMFIRLANLCKHHNKKVTYPGFTALDAFFRQVALELVSTERSEESNVQTFKFFIKKFFDMLDSQAGSNMREISIAIRGFGSFAGPMLMYMGVDELKKVFMKLLQYSDKFFAGEFEVYESIHHLPSFLNAFANISLQLGHVDDVHVDHLERLTSAVFVYFPQINLSRGLQIEYNRALSRLFVALFSAGAALQTLLSRIVLQGLALTCSNQLPGLEQEEDLANHKEPYKIYTYLWRAILVPERLADCDISDNVYEAMCGVIYDQFLRSILDVLNRLNLRSVVPIGAGADKEEVSSQFSETSESDSSDMIVSTLQPEVPKDFELFLNLVEFSRDILHTVNTECFMPWVYIFGREVIQLSNEYPLISGFYKLLSVAMYLCEKHSFFDEATSATVGEDSMDVDDDESTVVAENKGVCFGLFSKFIKEVLLRVQQYKNELLAACVKLVLSVPRQFIDVSLLVPALQVAFKIGLSYIELAEIGMDALEYWIRVVPSSIIPCLPKILPVLNSYLRIDDSNYDMESSEHEEKAQKFRQRAQSAGRGKTKDGKVTVVRKGKVTKLQHRILRLVGRLGGSSVSLADASDAESSESSTVVWDTVPRVQFQMPFGDLTSEVFLDTFLPRIVDLAENSQERQTKVCACELLHSITLFMVGTSANKHSEMTQFYKLYKHIFPALIRLATDVELVAKQLFKPLVLQLIHWFTKNAKHENVETMTLLDAIVEAVGNPSDGGLRSFSAVCLAEFLDSSIKHAARGKDADKSPTNVKSLFKRLYSLAHHPDAYKRLGCSMTFNQLYRIFRENETIVSQFILEILHNTIFSLRLANQDEPSLGTAASAAAAVANLSKIVVVYAKKGRLLKPDSHRRQHDSLTEFVDWLFGELSRPEDCCRKECMSLFSRCSPLLKGVKSTKDWIQRKLQLESVSWLFEQLEPEDPFVPTAEVDAGLTVDELRSFYLLLAALLDAYRWIFAEDLLDPSLIAIGRNKSCLFDGVQYFVSTCSQFDGQEDMFLDLTPSELEKYNSAKASATLNTFNLFLLLAEKFPDFESPCGSLETEEFYSMLFMSMLAPAEVGFSLNNSDQLKDLASCTASLCQTLKSSMEASRRSCLGSALLSVVQSDALNLKKVSLTELDVQRGTALLEGYKALHNSGLLVEALQDRNIAANLAKKVFEEGTTGEPSPTQLLVSQDVLSLCFSLGFEAEELMELLLDQSSVGPAPVSSVGGRKGELPGDKEATPVFATKGETFYHRYSSPVHDFFASATEDFMRELFARLHGQSLVVRILLDCIEAYSRKHLPAEPLFKDFLRHKKQLEPWYSSSSSAGQKDILLELLRKLVKLDKVVFMGIPSGSQLIKDVFMASMVTSTPLALKNQAMDLLPALLTQEEGELADVLKSLHNTVVYDFPVQSKDLVTGTVVYTDYLAALDKMFLALVESGHCIVLEPLFSVLREANHIYKDKIDGYLEDFTSTVKGRQARAAFELCFSVMLEQEHQHHLCQTLASQLCVPLVHGMSISEATSVFEKHVKELMKLITEPVDGVDSVVRKSCCLKLVEAMYDTLPSKTIREKINVVYCKAGMKAKGNELTTAIMKAAHAAKARSLKDTDAPNSICHEYYCTAYNTLAAVVMCTQSKEQFFTVFFFKENPEKHEYLWEHLVDLTKQYSFEVETRFPTMKMRLDAHKAGKRADEDGDVAMAGARPRYIASQYFADSSLSQDMSHVSALYMPSSDNSDRAAKFDEFVIAPPEDGQNAASPLKKIGGDVELELDAINENPCMPVFLRLLDHMMGLFGDSYTEVVPDWMELMLRTLSSDAVHTNVKLFIAKVVVNRPSIFRRYAKQWMRPLLELATSHAVGKGINYFLRDICITILLEWPQVELDSRTSQHLATKLFNHLICHAIYQNSTVVKYNLDLIKLFVERFHQHIAPSKSVVLELISTEARRSSAKIRRQTGLQILGVLVANKFPLYCKKLDQKISESQLIDALIGNLRHSSKSIYRAAAEIVGLVMHQEGTTTVLARKVKDQLTFMLQNYNKDQNIDRALECLSKIGIHCASFLDGFFLYLLDLLPKLFGVYSVMGLELVRLRAQHIDGLFKKLKPVLDKLISQRNAEAQLVTLQILQFLVNDITMEDAPRLMFTLGKAFAEHSDENCRRLYYDLLTRLYSRLEQLQDNRDIRTLLLRGLFDGEPMVASKMFAFWHSPEQLSADVIERLIQLFQDLYSPEIEDNWLKYSTHLMLSLCANSPDYDRELFPSLTNAQFHDYQIDCSWQNRSLPMSPMFSSQSLSLFDLDDMDVEMSGDEDMASSQDSDDSDVVMSSPRSERSQIRFTATVASGSQDQGRSQFATPTSQTLAALSSDGTYGVSPLSSSQASTPGQFSFAAPLSTPRPGGKATVSVLRRFAKQTVSSPQAPSGSFDRMQLLKQKRSRERRKLLAERRRNRITMLRTYRTGDLPDVQIKPKEVIQPLQALIGRDLLVSRHTFAALFKSLVQSLDKRKAAALRKQLTSLMEDLLEQSNCSPPFVSCLQWMCFENDIPIDAKLITNTALRSSNYHTGILLLEKQLLLCTEPTKTGRGSVAAAPDEELQEDWMELIKLYKALGDEDVLRGLFEKHLCSSPLTKQALEAELHGDYKSAYDLYLTALETAAVDDASMETDAPSSMEEQLWESSKMECLTKLLSWEDVAQAALSEAGGDAQKLLEPELRSPWLDHFVQSHVHVKTLLPALETFVDSCSLPERGRLEEEFVAEMSVLSVFRDDFDRARYLVGQYYEAFLKRWGMLHPLATVSRRVAMKGLQRVVELDEFLYFCAHEKNLQGQEKLDQLLGKWHSRMPSPEFHDINVWADVVSSRSLLFDKLYDRFTATWTHRLSSSTSGDPPSGAVDPTDLKKMLLVERSHSYLSMATAARKRNNLPVSERYLKLSLKSSKQAQSSAGFSYHFFKSLVKLYTRKAKISGSFEKFNMALEYVEEKKGKEAISGNPLHSQAALLMQAGILQEMATLVKENPDVDVSIVRMVQLKKGVAPSTSFLSTAHRCLDKACQTFRSAKDASLGQSRQAAKSYLALAKFCDDVLVQAEASDESAAHKRYAEVVLTNVLDAMALQLDGARDRFPRLLQLICSYSHLEKIFIEKVQKVPTWMFIRWISQMMGLLDKPQASAVVAVLIRIADEYPQALFYPFKISTEGMDLKTSSIIAPLHQRLSNPLMDQFIAALSKLTHPEHRFKDWTDEMKAAATAKDKARLRELFQEVYEDCFNARAPGIGSYNRQFASTYGSVFVSKFGSNGSKLVNMDARAFLTAAQPLVAKMTAAIQPRGTSHAKVDAYSTWLVEFDRSNQLGDATQIEIPGQYSGLVCPHVSNHIYISSFDSDTLVMGSLRKPKRLKIRGNDQQDHPFLVKGGEDLRLDQRVQQLFSVMNELFRQDAECTRRGLALPTYEVVPMTGKVGLIEWIDNTKPIKALIEEEIAKGQGKAASTVSIQKIPAAKVHDQWLSSFSNRGKIGDMHAAMYKQASRASTVKKVEQQYSTIPASLLRTGVLSLSSSPEAYLSIRAHFARSLASFSIASYIIGIGDRHLENFLLNYRDGGLVGIDFGHAFGTATQFLPVPELVPFRLTRQFTEFLKPLDSEGLLNHNMIHCMRTLQENREILLDTMNVFITEPLLDWEKFARRCAREQGSEEDASVWFPKEKIGIVRKKLSRYNPVHIMVQELRTSVHGKKPYLRNLEAIVAGEAKHNVRARLGERCDTVAEQVECLVDLASDPNVLGRMYGGWASWI